MAREASVPALMKMAVPPAEQSPPRTDPAKLSLPSLAAAEERIGARPFKPPPERQQEAEGRQRQGMVGRQRQGTETGRLRQGTLRGSLSTMPEGSVLTEDDRTCSALWGDGSGRRRDSSMEAYLSSLDRLSQAPKAVKTSWRWRRKPSRNAQDAPSSIRGSLSAMLGFGRSSRASFAGPDPTVPYRHGSDESMYDESSMDAYLSSLDDRRSQAPQVRTSWRFRGLQSSRQSFATDYGFSGRGSPQMDHADRSFARGADRSFARGGAAGGPGPPGGAARAGEATR